jgi:allantoinase
MRVDMPLNSVPPTIDVATLETKRTAAAGQCHVDVGFWGGAVPGNLADLRPLHDAGVFGFKCFLVDSGVEEFPPPSARELTDALTELSSYDALTVVHAEDPEVVEGRRRARTGLRRLPEVAAPRCGEPGGRDRDRGDPGDRRSHSRAPPVELRRRPDAARRPARGLHMTVETYAHYLSFDAASIAPGATQFKCCPLIRKADNREEVWRALAAGDIDCVVSDPSSRRPGCPPSSRSSRPVAGRRTAAVRPAGP